MTYSPAAEGAWQRLVLIAILAVYLIISLATVFTARPDTDDAVYANPGYNLLYNGHTGTTIYQLGEHAPYSLAKRSYWQPPLYFLTTAFWYKVFGFSLLTTRLLSTLSGLVIIGAWYIFTRRLFDSALIGVVTAALVSSDYFLLMASGRGRMDLLSVAFGSAALAVYVTLRERRPATAVFLSHLLAALSFLTHPCGIAWAVMLCILTFWIDRNRISVRSIAIAAAAYILCLTPWALYLSLDLQAWREQMARILEVNDSAFVPKAFSSIRWVRLLEQEVVYRYLGPYGLSSGASAAGRVKALVLLAYLVSAAGLLFWPRSPQADRRRILPVLFLITFLIIGEASPSKFFYYLPHTTTLLAACTAVFLCTLLPLRRTVLTLAVLVIAGLQIAGIAVGIRQNTLAHQYRPMIDAVLQNSHPGGFVMGSGELWFELSNRRTLLHDAALGAFSGLRPEVLVIDPQYLTLHAAHATSHPDWYAYETKLLAESTLVYKNEYYQVYRVPPLTSR